MTNTITITTQAEFDALPNDFAKYTYIKIKNDPTNLGAMTVNRAWDRAIVVVDDIASVVSCSASVEARGSSHVEAWDSSHVEVCGSSHVEAWDSSHVVSWDSSHVVSWDSSHVEACGNSHVSAYDSSHVEACDSAHVEAYGSAHVAVCGDAHVSAYDSSHVVAFDSSTVTYSGDLASFANWFSINKDDKYVVNQIKKQFANQPDYMRKINMVLIFS